MHISNGGLLLGNISHMHTMKKSGNILQKGRTRSLGWGLSRETHIKLHRLIKKTR